MADPRNSPEIVTEQDLKPVLESSSFDANKFLKLYNQWKGSNNQDLFFELRGMCKIAGYTNKQVFTKTEQEMDEIAAIVQRYQDSKNQVTNTAAAATSGVRQTVPVAIVPAQEITEESIRKQSEDIRKSLDATMTMEKLETSLKLTESLARMIPEKHTTLGRGVIGSMMLGRLQELGYSLSVDSKNQVLIRSEHTDKVQEVKNKINAFVAVPGSVMLDIIKTGTLYMSPTFREYAASNMVDGKVTGLITPTEYGKYLGFKQEKDPKKITFSDINFLDSLKDGGYNGFNFTQAIIQSQGLGKVAQFIDSNPAIAEKIATTVAPAVNPGTLPVTSTSSPSQRPSTTAGKAAGVVGEGVGAVAGGIGAVVGNVASETASTWSTILSEATKSGGAFGAIGVIGLVIASIWKFGFGKTLMGIIGVGGASAIANAAENGTFDKFADKMKKGGDKVGKAIDKITGDNTAVPVAAPTVTTPAAPTDSVDVSKLSPSQKKALEKINTDKEFLGSIDTFADKKTQAKQVETAKSGKYIEFIMSENFQKIPLEKLIYTGNADISVFRSTETLDPSLKVPNDLNNSLLKKMILLYLVGSTKRELVSGRQAGDKEREEFEKKYPASDWKSKPLSDITQKIYQ